MKTKAAEQLLRMIHGTIETLRVLNVSDCNMGCENVHATFMCLANFAKGRFEAFHCDFNECDNRELYGEIIRMVRDKEIFTSEMKTICSFAGNRDVSKEEREQIDEVFREMKITFTLQAKTEYGDEDDYESDGDEGTELNRERFYLMQSILEELVKANM